MNPSQKSLVAIAAKIVTQLRSKNAADLQSCRIGPRGLIDGSQIRQLDALHAQQVAGNVIDARDQVDRPCCHGGGRHFSILRPGAIAALSNGKASASLDRLESQGTVIAGAGQYNAYCAFAL